MSPDRSSPSSSSPTLPPKPPSVSASSSLSSATARPSSPTKWISSNGEILNREFVIPGEARVLLFLVPGNRGVIPSAHFARGIHPPSSTSHQLPVTRHRRGSPMTPSGYFLTHLWVVPLFPLITGALMLFIGRLLPKAAVSFLCVGSVLLSFLQATGAVLELRAAPPGNRVFQLILFEWITPGIMPTSLGLTSFVADWGYLLDPLSSVMVLVVTGVGFLIHVYSIGYMGHEGGYYRFFGYMNLFMFSMLTLVLANNMLLMFVGWEGVGLCSYLLIGFYFLRKSAADAGKKAFLVNRIGDAGFILGILLTAATFGTIRFTSAGLADAAANSGILQALDVALSAHALAAGAPVLTTIALLLFVGATGKSAQIPLYVWLPDALEAPN